jgi:hypothetical protein
MTTTNGMRSWSDDDISSKTTNALQSNDRTTDRASYRAANGTGLEGESPYLSSTRRGYGSAVELREYAADANSGRPPSRGPHPASSRTFAPQTRASKSSQPAADVDAERDAQYGADPVCASIVSNPRARDSDLQPQPRGGAGGPHNLTSPSSKSSDLHAPKGPLITQRGGAILGPMKPSRTMPGQSRAATSPLASKNIPKSSRLRVINGDTSFEAPQGASSQAEVEPPRGANLNRSGSQNVDHPSLTQTPAGKYDHPPLPPKDLPIPGRSLAPRAPGVTRISSSRRTEDTAPGEPQAFRERPLPAVPAAPNESRETVPLDMKGSHESLNWQLTPNDVSHLPVRHSQQDLLSDASYHLNHLPERSLYPTGCRSLHGTFLCYHRTPPQNTSEGCHCCYTIEYTQPPPRLVRFRV